MDIRQEGSGSTIPREEHFTRKEIAAISMGMGQTFSNAREMEDGGRANIGALLTSSISPRSALFLNQIFLNQIYKSYGTELKVERVPPGRGQTLVHHIIGDAKERNAGTADWQLCNGDSDETVLTRKMPLMKHLAPDKAPTQNKPMLLPGTCVNIPSRRALARLHADWSYNLRLRNYAPIWIQLHCHDK